MALNKLGLTQEERTVFYKDADDKSWAAEIRHFDPVYGFMKLLDPMNNTVIEFFWDSDSSNWKGTGVQSGYTTEVSIETPITKEIDSNVPAKATTVSRFPPFS